MFNVKASFGVLKKSYNTEAAQSVEDGKEKRKYP
jgi:hypothetical protein